MQDPGSLEFPIECAAALEALLTSGGGPGIEIGELPAVEDCDIDALGVAQVLAEQGLLEVLAA